MQVGFDRVRNADFKHNKYYLLEIKTKQSKILTIGKFDESELCFKYFDYEFEEYCMIDIFETRKLLGVYSIKNALRDIDYYRAINRQ